MSSRYPGGVVRKNQLVPTTSSASGMWTIGQAAQATKSDIWPYGNIANPISQSLRFRSSASAYLNRTPSSTGNRQIFTWSSWIKLGLIPFSANGYIFSSRQAASDNFGINITTGSAIQIDGAVSSTALQLTTSAVYRDPSSWYHVVLAVDTTQATASNRIKLYVNGTQITSFSTSTYPAQNSNLAVNLNTAVHNIGAYNSGGSYYDGYQTEINFIDGQQLDPSYFGQTSAITGVWQPISYSGTYGTNGFHLEFKDTTVGKDTSGNNNHWTPNNISISTDTSYDLVKDVPVSWTTRDGTTVRGNYATWNSAWKHYPWTSATLSEGNLKAAKGGHVVAVATMPIKTPTYWEIYIGWNNCIVGIIDGDTTYTGTYSYNDPTVKGVYTYTMDGYVNGSGIVSSGGPLASDNGPMTLMFAVDPQNGKMWVGKNGTWNGNPSAGTGAFWTTLSTTANYFPWFHAAADTQANDSWVNFGQRPYTYTPPTGFKNLCTTNLPTPTIGATVANAVNKYFDISLYTGNGTTQSITNNGLMQPDFVWIKSRSSARKHNLYDAIRGVGKELYSHLTDAETNAPDSLTAFNSNGFSLGNDGGSNANAQTFVGWQWNAGGTTVTNTSGTQTAQVRANPTAGFSIVTFTSTSTNVNGTVGHGLGIAPKFIIVKDRGLTSNWVVYHPSVSTDVNKFLRLNTTDATTTLSSIWGDALPTSTVFGIRGDVTVQASDTCVAYCWSEIDGFSKFGSYTGNASTNGPFVYTGFRPKFIMFKGTGTRDWVIRDTSRDTYNTTHFDLYPNSVGAEESGGDSIDILSNGFKLKATGASFNGSGETYIYAAFAETPFKTALAR